MLPAQLIRTYAEEGQKLRNRFFQESGKLIEQAAFAIALCFAKGGKLLLCGNGGSAADCQHMAAEFVNRFLLDRPALPAIALTTDTSALTAIGNDSHFEFIFARQVEALGLPGDILLGISTSGRSKNVLAAMEIARSKMIQVIGLCGQNGDMRGLCQHLIAVPSVSTPLIQEIHLGVEHLLCRLVDYYLFEQPEAIRVALQTRSGE